MPRVTVRVRVGVGVGVRVRVETEVELGLRRPPSATLTPRKVASRAGVED